MSPSMKDLPSLFERTPVPTFPKAAAFVRTAAAWQGDLRSGKTHDTNSHRVRICIYTDSQMAKLCFELGLDMKRA
ncbi:hypothetical protein Malapachy_3571 [Malassezia pachydermatis]|uniref:Uncharacterized protein n=1 Tax=Malassezia pachydermatis TaxID=77020 RepID=A0A0M8MTD4_9BASI|nr:hypothetical protein Malapachy_3571 [Malassezia pachydermatis]KOS16357.1 hypothetical protein Malapachy_3571 [Malassezia pachydermatis]